MPLVDKWRFGLTFFLPMEQTLADVSENPVGYTDGSMDQEMNFPNPVARTDLPTKRRRWPRIVGGLVVLLILTVVACTLIGDALSSDRRAAVFN